MIVGKVVNNIVSSRKHEKLIGYKLLVIEPLLENRGPYLVVADELGAGIGDTVLITQGCNVKYGLKEIETPIDAIVVGIVDDDNVKNHKNHP